MEICNAIGGGGKKGRVQLHISSLNQIILPSWSEELFKKKIKIRKKNKYDALHSKHNLQVEAIDFVKELSLVN